MTYARFSILLLLLSCVFPNAIAQKKRSIWQHGILHTAEKLLAKRYFNANVDTLYVVRPNTKWVLKSRVNLSGSTMYFLGSSKKGDYSALLTSDNKTTLNISAGYLGLSVGVSVNPASWAGKYHDYEFNLNSYGNRWGVDIIYHKQQSAGGWIDLKNYGKQHIDAGALLSKTLNINAYLAFNYKRFSFPAAFSQSYIQRRSAGSWLMGLSLMGQWMAPKTGSDNGIPLNKLNSLHIALGAGYGYNFVMPKSWMIHLSAIPTVALWSKTYIWNGKEWNKASSHFPDIIITGRTAVLKNFNRNFMGVSLIANFSIIGEKSRLMNQTTKWRIRAFYGWRF